MEARIKRLYLYSINDNLLPLLEYVLRAKPEDVLKDEEGLYAIRVLARNMAFFLKCKEVGIKAGISLPSKEKPVFTNFICE